jgi:hypothetical protein
MNRNLIQPAKLGVDPKLQSWRSLYKLTDAIPRGTKHKNKIRPVPMIVNIVLFWMLQVNYVLQLEQLQAGFLPLIPHFSSGWHK